MRLKGSSPGSPDGAVYGGLPGRAATVEVGETVTGSAGTDAAVVNSGSYSEAVLDFTIPRGTAVTVGSTTTGLPGTAAAVSNSGTIDAAVLDFTVPRGDVGPTGPPGADGEAIVTGIGDATNLGRFVCSTAAGQASASDGANTWAKICTVQVLGGARDVSLVLSCAASYVAFETAQISFSVRGGTAGVAPSVVLDMTAKGGAANRISASSFKAVASVADGSGNNSVELWMKKTATYGQFGFYEISRYTYSPGTIIVTYHQSSAWQTSEPVGSAVNVVSNGVTAFGQRVVTHDAATFPSTLVSTTGAQTVTNKTISGDTNTVTNLPASATPDAARLVCTPVAGGAAASDGANTWVKLVTATSGVNYDVTNLLLSVMTASSNNDTAIVSFHTRNAATGVVPTVSVEVIAKAGQSYISPTAFKVVNNGFGLPVELWMKKTNTYGSFKIYELARYKGTYTTITYNEGGAWQAAEPSGSNVSVSRGVTAFGQPVVTHDAATFPSTLVSTTGAQVLTNKTISGASNTLTNIPPSATPDAARLVRTLSSTTLGQWAKVLTLPTAGAYKRANVILSVTAYNTNASAIIGLELGTAAADASPTGSVTYLAKGPGSLADDAFKVVCNGYGQDLELWFKANGNGSILRFYELGKYEHTGIVYGTTTVWQESEPVGTVLNYSSYGLTFGNLPVGVKVAVPASATSTGVVGQWAADASYHYVCTATNTWRRAALSTW